MDFPRPGDSFEGHYRVLAVLGEGGFATVFSALDADGNRVAIKILRPDEQGYSFETSSRFTREIQVLATLSDPHTVRLLDYGRAASGLLYMVFEHVPGRDLSDVLAEYGALPPRVAVDIVRQVLCSLREAHAAGLLHRDLKPGNVRIFEQGTDRWRAKLLDFGIARPMSPTEHSGVTRAGQLLGTPRYMSPEQLTEGLLGPQSDLYSLGLMAIEMLDGPHSLAGNRWGDQIDRLHDGYAFPLRDDYGDRGALNAWVQRLSARLPEQRFASAEDALRALDAVGVSSKQRPRAAQHTSAPRFEEASPSARATRAALALVAIAAAVFALAVVLGRRPPPTPVTVVVRAPEPVDVPPPPRQHAAVPVAQPDQGPDLADIATASAAGADAGADTGEPADGEQVKRSLGCGSPPNLRGVGNFNYVDGLSQTEWLGYVPRKYDPEHPHPLIVLFHQDMQTAAQILAQSRLAEVAERERFIVIAPQGEPLLPWRTAMSVRGVEELVEQTGEVACVDLSRIYLVGHAAGGIAAEHLACEPWVAGAAFVSYRTNVERLHCEGRATPTLYLATTEGSRMLLEGGIGCAGIYKISLARNEELWRERNVCADTRRTWHTAKQGVCYDWACETPFVSCHLAGGHGWPGPPTQEVDPGGCDPPQANFPAAEVIWRFFATKAR